MAMNEQTKQTNGADKKAFRSVSPNKNKMKTNTKKKTERNSCRQWHTIFLILLFWNSLLNPRKQQDCSLANKSNPTLGLAYFVAAILSILHHWSHPVWFCSMIGWTRYARQTNKWTNGRTREKKQQHRRNHQNRAGEIRAYTQHCTQTQSVCIVTAALFYTGAFLWKLHCFTFVDSQSAHDIHNSAMYRPKAQRWNKC